MFSQNLGSSELGTWRKAGSMMLSLSLHIVIAGFLLVSVVLVTHNLLGDCGPQMMVASLNYSFHPGGPGQFEPQPNTLRIPDVAIVQVDTHGSSTIQVEETHPGERVDLLVLGPPPLIQNIPFGPPINCGGCTPDPTPRRAPGSVTPVLVERHSWQHQAVLLKRVDPEYPAFAKRAGIHGAVVLHATVDREGRIIGLLVVSGPNQLRQAAVDAVRQWRYQPYVLNGLAVDIQTTITVNFVLADEFGRNPSRIL